MHRFQSQPGLRCAIRRGQPDDHGDPATRCVLDRKLPSHRFHKSVGYGQPQPDTTVAVGITEPLKRLEQPSSLAEWDTRAPVDDPQIHATGHLPRVDPNGARAG